MGGTFGAYMELLALCGFYVLAADFVVLVVHALQRQWKLGLADLFALLFALFPLVCHLHVRWSGADEHDSAKLKVVSWNVGNFSLKSECLDDLANVMLSEEPDIICLQERPHQHLMSKKTIESRFPDYPYIAYNDREDEVLNLMVLSKYPLSGLSNHYFADSYNKYMSVDVDVDGRRLRLYNVHLQTTGVTDVAGANLIGKIGSFIDNAQIRCQQARQLSDDIHSQSGSNVMVCGDFNTPAYSSSFQTVSRGMYDASWSRMFSLLQSSYSVSSFLPKIDHILFSEPIACLDYQLREFGWTDHKMQCAVFKIN